MGARSGPLPMFSRSLSLMLGGVVLALAAALAFWSIGPAQALGWALTILGPGFIGLLALLAMGALYCLVRIWQGGPDPAGDDFWLATGLQCANGISTLALTYTLFGISVGIGALAGQGLSPDTVEGVIRDLTRSFSLAFMTTVIGLPLSALIRGLLVVAHGRKQLASASSHTFSEGHSR